MFVHTSVVESDDRTTSVSCVAKGALCCCSAGDTREQTSRSTASGLNVHSLRSSLNDSFLQDTYAWIHTHVCTLTRHILHRNGTALAQTVSLCHKTAQLYTALLCTGHQHTSNNTELQDVGQTKRKQLQTCSLLPLILYTLHASSVH